MQNRRINTHRAQCRGVKGFPSSWINVLNSSKTSKQSSCPEEKHTQHWSQQTVERLLAGFGIRLWNQANLCKQPSVMGCIVCCPAVYLVGLLPWQPAPDWPGSPCGPWMQRSAAGYYPERPDTVQKLCAPAGLSHSHRDPAPPGQRSSQEQADEAAFTQRKTLRLKTEHSTPGPRQYWFILHYFVGRNFLHQD